MSQNFAIEKDGTLRIFRLIKKGSKTRYGGGGTTTKNRTVSARCDEFKKPQLLGFIQKHFGKRVDDTVEVVVQKPLGKLTNKELCAYLKQRVASRNNNATVRKIKETLNERAQANLAKYAKYRAGATSGTRRAHMKERYNALAKERAYPTRRATCKELSRKQIARLLGEKYSSSKHASKREMCRRAQDLKRRGIISYPAYANRDKKIDRKEMKRKIKAATATAQKKRKRAAANSNSNQSNKSRQPKHIRFNNSN